jgi:uncharacterized cupredoxin-like copper-binding protein
MIQFSKLVAVATFASLSFAPFALAAKPIEVLKVDLAGEADQPMKIDLSKAVIKAGIVELVVTNAAIGTDHEMVLVKLANKDTPLVVDPKTHRIDEKKLKSMGEVAGLKAGQTGKLKVKLAPGEYILVCNHASHFELGMATHLTVTK